MGKAIGFGRRDVTHKKHWHDSYFESDFSIPNSEKKKIICFPGGECNSPKKANGMCKLVEAALTDEAKMNCEIWSAYWPDSSNTDYERFFAHHFLPIIANEKGVQKAKQGQTLDNSDALPVAEAEKNMRNVILFNHCKGGYITEELESYLCNAMQAMGYSPDDIAGVMKQLFALNANDPNEALGDSKATVLRRLSFVDKTSGERKKFGNIKYVLYHNCPEQHVDIFELSDNEAVIFADKTLLEEGNDFEHDDGFLVRDKMNDTGRNIFDLSKGLLSQVVLSEGRIPDISVLLERAAEQSSLTEFLHSAKQNGEKYMQFAELKIADYEKMREQIINKIKKGELTELPAEADADMLAEDYNGTQSALFYALEKADTKQLSLILERVKETEVLKQGQCGVIDILKGKLTSENQEKLQPVLEPYLNCYLAYNKNYDK